MAKRTSRRRASARRSDASQLAAKQGLSPGTATFTGEDSTADVGIQRLQFSVEGVEEKVLSSVDDALSAFAGVTWINVDGLHDVATVQRLAEQAVLHPLTVEDVLNVSTPPKTEDYGAYLFVVAVMVHLRAGVDGPEFVTEQVSLVLGPGWVLTFQERPGDLFDALRRRIRAGTGRVRKRSADYLLHVLLDAIVDGYFVALEALDQELFALEAQITEGVRPDVVARIHSLSAELRRLRRHIWPLQGAVAELLRSESGLLEERTTPFLRDLADHVRQAIEIVDGARERLAASMQLHLALVSHRTNETMRLLTVVSTIFIPLTFIAGIYGMNFQWMPELTWEWGYPVVMAVMLALGASMGAWFRSRQWL